MLASQVLPFINSIQRDLLIGTQGLDELMVIVIPVFV